MTVIEQSEVETFLGFPIVTKAEPYVPTPGRFTGGRPVDGAGGVAAGSSTSLLIAAVIVSAFLVILIIIALLFLMHRTGSKNGGRGGLAAALKQRKLMSGTPTSATSGPSQGLSQDKTSLAGSVRKLISYRFFNEKACPVFQALIIVEGRSLNGGPSHQRGSWRATC